MKPGISYSGSGKKRMSNFTSIILCGSHRNRRHGEGSGAYRATDRRWGEMALPRGNFFVGAGIILDSQKLYAGVRDFVAKDLRILSFGSGPLT